MPVSDAELGRRGHTASRSAPAVCGWLRRVGIARMAEEAKGSIRRLNKKIGKSFDRYGVEGMRKVLIAYAAALAMACSAQQPFAAVFVSGLQTSPVAPFIPDPSTFLAEITFTPTLGGSRSHTSN